MNPNPLISCLMVTPANDDRIAFVQKSIEDFSAQTYSPRELVIVLDSPKAADMARLKAITAPLPNVRLIEVKEKRNLGALRNRAIQEAKGEILCQWDDDDRYHRRRLEVQVQALVQSKADVVFLQNVFHYFPKTKELYWTNWDHTERKGHPASLMCKKECAFTYPEEGEKSQKGEDLEALLWLRKQFKVTYIPNPVYLYTYVFHGTNTWHAQHHRSLAVYCAESRAFINAHKEDFLEAMRELPFRHKGFLVMDKLGMVWPWSPKKV